MNYIDALYILNNRLGLSASITFRGDEVKAWKWSEEEANRNKTYFSKADLLEIAEAFEKLAEYMDEEYEYPIDG